MFRIFAVALGGALGALARYGAAVLFTNRLGRPPIVGTFTINITACFLIGVVLTLLARRPEIDPFWRYLVPVGFIGAYSTFSTFEWEIFLNLEIGAFATASLYLVGSIVCGLVAVWFGALLARLAF